MEGGLLFLVVSASHSKAKVAEVTRESLAAVGLGAGACNCFVRSALGLEGFVYGKLSPPSTAAFKWLFGL